MKSTKKTLLILLLLLTLLVTACGTTSSAPAPAAEAPEETPAAESSAEAADGDAAAAAETDLAAGRTIEDHLGRQVELPDQPERVLALTRNFMEELFELGITPVGKVEEYKNRQEGIDLPSVSNQNNPNLEAIAALAPELIFANTRQHADLLESLEEISGAVVFIDPNKVIDDPLVSRILFMAEVLNRKAEGENYIAQLDAVTAELQAKVAPLGYETGLILEIGDKVTAAQPTGFFGALLHRMNIENIVPLGLPGSGQSTWVDFDAETILAEDPDIVLLRASGNDKDEHKQLLEDFKNNPAWSELSAVKNNQLFILPAQIAPGNISNEEALRRTAKIIGAGE
ncbi:ABC transporter substrate-binding protein [Anoxynatronum buryatiense]|uniref:Iron complex transport system substrate-binding protein n=1 Tax=Anoxynatronum buryatiense TaxID=489973 RepID=A0AA46AKI9_9CLOT|nr:ABC transporter substrate-binding protein [Anoxynatronum buryatiense]SMP71146.1 iron complex transport system substrate-binding protein [Anoxynatronum buryatiense]